jgi:hypothetical protein
MSDRKYAFISLLVVGFTKGYCCPSDFFWLLPQAEEAKKSTRRSYGTLEIGLSSFLPTTRPYGTNTVIVTDISIII